MLSLDSFCQQSRLALLVEHQVLEPCCPQLAAEVERLALVQEAPALHRQHCVMQSQHLVVPEGLVRNLAPVAVVLVRSTATEEVAVVLLELLDKVAVVVASVAMVVRPQVVVTPEPVAVGQELGITAGAPYILLRPLAAAVAARQAQHLR